MKKKILALLLSVLIGISSVSAQQLQTLLSSETVAYSEKHNFSFAGYDDIYFYIVEFDQEKKKVTADLSAYSRTTLKQAFSSPISVPPFEGDKFSLHEILFAEDKILVFYSFYSKKDKLQQLMVTHYATDGTPSGKAIEVMRASGKTKTRSGHFKVTSSENRKYFFVWHHPSAYGLGENTFAEYTVEILNADLETLYAKESMLEKGSAELKRILVNNDGNVYIFADQQGGADEENFIKSINLKSKTEKHNEVGRKFKIKSFATGSDFFVDEKGTVYFIGLYSPTYDEMKTKGIYVAGLQENGTIKNDAVIPYSMTDDKKPKSKPKRDIVKEYYSIRDVKFREGNVSILSCKNWLAAGNTEKTTTKFGEGMFQYTVDYNFKLLSETFVLRNQTADNEKEMAFDIPFFNAEASCLMFNDTKENMESENPEVKEIKKFSGKAIAQFVSFKPDGGFIKEPLFTEKPPSKRLLIPERYLKMNNDEVVVLTKLAESYKFCKVFSENK